MLRNPEKNIVTKFSTICMCKLSPLEFPQHFYNILELGICMQKNYAILYMQYKVYIK